MSFAGISRGQLTMHDILGVLGALADAGEPCAVATVIETRGSASAKPGSKAVIDRRGRVIEGWVGGGCAQTTVCHAGLECIGDGATRIIDLNLDDEVLGTGMPCGGSMRVFVEPLLPKPALWVLGHGAITEALCDLGVILGFRVVVDDPMAEQGHYPEAVRLITDDLDYSQLTPGPDDYVVVATQHKGDHQSMLRLTRSPCRYVALIASGKRAGLVLDFLRQEGVAEAELAAVRAPAGLDLGAATPEEIALSVLAEIVMVRRHGSGRAKHLDLRAGRSEGEPVAALQG